jgi:hypothetical protein
MEGQFRNGAGPKGFSYDVLAAATGNFSDDQKLGEGGFGSVYRGFLDQLNLHVEFPGAPAREERVRLRGDHHQPTEAPQPGEGHRMVP